MTTLTPRPTEPSTDLRLARLHLRVGLLGLARAELEALAGSGALDDDGLLALAEARWRTGDLTGAGEAAQAYLAPGGSDLTALVIAAESVAAVGRPGEARRIAGRALEQADLPLDRIFAGMPRSSIWPADPADAGSTSETLFGAEPGRRAAHPAAAPPLPGARATAPTGPGFWDTELSGTHELPDAATLIEIGRASLDVGRLPEAALALGLAVRTSPALAPLVLDALDRAAVRSPALELVRGDAYRIVGHELDAQRTWVAAAAALKLAPASAGSAVQPDAPRPQEDS